MRLSEKMERVGIFWSPENPKDHTAGTLFVSTEGKIELRLFGYYETQDYLKKKQPFGLPPMAESTVKDIGRILGIIGGEPLTLEGCYYVRWNSFPIGGVATSVIRAEYAFLGVNFNLDEVITFSKFDFSVEGFGAWLGITGFETDYNYQDESEAKQDDSVVGRIRILYEKPADQTFILSSGLKLSLVFTWSSANLLNLTDAHITQKVYFSLISDKPLPHGRFLELAQQLTDFLRFAIDEPVSIEFMTGYSDQKVRPNSGLIPIKLYYQSNPFDIPEFEIRTHQMLFCYRDVRHQIREILISWLGGYETTEPVFKLYFSTKLNTKTYLENRFLALIRAAEVLHRSKFVGKVMPEGKFEEFRNTVVGDVSDPKLREFLYQKLQYANEVSLRKRLQELIKFVYEFFGEKKEHRMFIDKVVVTRNYLTHFDEQLKNRSAHDADLFYLCQKLEVLIQLYLLKLIGLDEKSIWHIVGSNSMIKFKLKHR